MYRLTPLMLQRLNRDLEKYHALFAGGRCSGWELEELIVKAIQSDTQAQHQIQWQEAGHDDLADMTVIVNGTAHPLQIKSGKITGVNLVLSGHRLGRFADNFDALTNYLNANSADIITVPYRQINDEHGRQHCYKVCYVDVSSLTGISANLWKKKGKQFIQTNDVGVVFSLRPAMSWQIWWTIPIHLLHTTDEFCIS